MFYMAYTLLITLETDHLCKVPPISRARISTRSAKTKEEALNNFSNSTIEKNLSFLSPGKFPLATVSDISCFAAILEGHLELSTKKKKQGFWSKKNSHIKTSPPKNLSNSITYILLLPFPSIPYLYHLPFCCLLHIAGSQLSPLSSTSTSSNTTSSLLNHGWPTPTTSASPTGP